MYYALIMFLSCLTICFIKVVTIQVVTLRAGDAGRIIPKKFGKPLRCHYASVPDTGYSVPSRILNR